MLLADKSCQILNCQTQQVYHEAEHIPPVSDSYIDKLAELKQLSYDLSLGASNVWTGDLCIFWDHITTQIFYFNLLTAIVFAIKVIRWINSPLAYVYG